MSVRLCNLLSSPARTAEVVCEMSQTNRIKLISRNMESQRLRDPFNSHPRCPLNAAPPPPSFLFFKNSTTELLFVSVFLKRSSLFKGPACAALHAGDNKFPSCSQIDKEVKTLQWIFSLPPHRLTVVVFGLFLLSALPVTTAEVCDCCAAAKPPTVCPLPFLPPSPPTPPPCAGAASQVVSGCLAADDRRSGERHHATTRLQLGGVRPAHRCPLLSEKRS